MVWVVTWLSVVVLNVDLGLAIGVVFSMMTVICRTQRYIFHFLCTSTMVQSSWCSCQTLYCKTYHVLQQELCKSMSYRNH